MPDGLQSLEQRLTATVREAPGDFGIAVMDLDTGAVTGVNRDTPYPMASTVKVAVAATFLSQVDAGQRSLDDMIGTVSAGQLMERMLIHSNNQATDTLIGALGGPQVVDAWLRRQGLTGIRVDRNIAQLLAARRDLWDVRDSSTPVAMLRLLRLIDRGNVLTPRSRATLLDIMSRCATGSNRIRGLLPAGTRIEHKTGTLTGYTGDVALVTLPDGRRIAMAMFARGGTNRPAVIASASRTIYDAFVDGQLGGQLGQRSTMARFNQQDFSGPVPLTGGNSQMGGVPAMARGIPGVSRGPSNYVPGGPPIMFRQPHPGQPLSAVMPPRDRPDRVQPRGY